MTTTKKTKKLTNEQKVKIYDTIDNEGAVTALVNGYLDAEVKGTTLAPVVKEAKKALQKFNGKLEKLGMDYDNIQFLRALNQQNEANVG